MNRLARETSPYLLQHKDNPVDWYPWGAEALDRARAENKPILLSIGYSACHWCHVMEHESFENEAIARLMNERFVCIKVDREERPDLDHIYQGVAQAITRGGGWPLTVFLTPELKPYFGGTYFPPEDRYGRPGFPRVLEALADAFRDDPGGVAENAEKLTAFIRGMDRVSATVTPEGLALERGKLEFLAERMADAFDPVLGGMAGAPKFPNAMLLSFLGRATSGRGAGPGTAAHAAWLTTLDRMAAGGIFDQLGGGFHRYSVDETWTVPHFEKMLYDNGLLLRVYAEALLAGTLPGAPPLSPGRRALYLRVLRMTVEYLLREMRGPEGAFFAAQDADSEGEEGKFFVWTPAELDSLVSRGVITQAGARAFTARFGVTEGGNFEHGATVLHLAQWGDGTAAAALESLESPELSAASRALLAERAKRVPPATDRKCLASWNGLVISGLAWAAQALRLAGDSALAARAIEAARGAYECVVTRFRLVDGELAATLQEGQPKHRAYLDDYAFMAQAALDLSRFDGDADDDSDAGGAGRGTRLLAQARQWADRALERFGDASGPGFYFTADDHESLIHRPKTVFDQAIPSGTAVMCGVLLVLGDLLDSGGERYAQEARRQLGGLASLAEKAPLGMGELLCSSWLAALGPVTVQGRGVRDFCRHPHVYRKPGAATQGWSICHQGACLPPVSDPAQLASGLAARV